jgi:hypothetical protein
MMFWLDQSNKAKVFPGSEFFIVKIP